MFLDNVKSKKVEVFINVFNSQRRLAELLFLDDKDVDVFCNKFYKTNKFNIDDLLDFRTFKINEENISLESFLDMCKTDLKIAFESVFIQSLEECMVDEIESMILKNEIDLEDVFIYFKKNTDMSVFKYIMS